MTAFGQYGFGVELHSLYRQGSMAQTHNDRPALLSGAAGFRRAGRNFQLPGQRVLGNDQRVIASARERRRQSREDALAIVIYFAGLAMHQAVRAHYQPAKRLSNGLMPKANTENRHLPSHVPDQRNQDPRFSRRARSRR